MQLSNTTSFAPRFYDWHMHCPEHEPLREIFVSASGVARVLSPDAVK